METLSFSLSNDQPLTVGLSSKAYPTGDVNLNYGDLMGTNPNQAKLLQLLYKALSKEDLPEDATLVTVLTDMGAFKTAFGPCFCTNKEKTSYGIYLAGQFFPLQKAKSRNTYISHVKDAEIEARLVAEEFNGYDDVVLKINILKGEKLLLNYAIPVRYTDLKDYEVNGKKGKRALDPDQMSIELWSNSPKILKAVIDGQPSSVPAQRMHLLIQDSYDVVDYDLKQTKDGRDMGFLTIKGKQNEIGEYVQEYLDPNDPERKTKLAVEEVVVWATKANISSLRLEAPKLSEENPATLIIRSVKPGKVRDGKPTFKVDSSLILPVSEQKTEVSQSSLLDW